MGLAGEGDLRAETEIWLDWESVPSRLQVSCSLHTE